MTRDDRDIPGNWDALVDRGPRPRPSSPGPAEPAPHRPPALTVMAAAWADLVAMLAVCTGALAAILVIGERPALPAFTWAAALAVVWWVFTAGILVVVRQATPGMLLAGLTFADPVAPRRVGWVLAAALVGVVTLGLSGVIGGDGSILCQAAASGLSDTVA